MKNFTTFLAFMLVVSFSLHAEVIHNNYGEGIVIADGANQAMDFDDDGSTDFYFNPIAGTIGIDPSMGCFIRDYTPSGVLIVRAETGNDPLVNDDDPFEDFNPGTIFSSTIGMAPGWEDGEVHLVGFMYFVGHKFAWMKVVPNVSEGTLTILEMAYETNSGESIELPELVEEVIDNPRPAISFTDLEVQVNNPRPAISFIDLEVTSTSVDPVLVEDLLIAPNPASDYVQVRFDNLNEGATEVLVYNALGILMHKEVVQGKDVNLQIAVANWGAGMYNLVIANQKGALETRRIIVKE